MIVKRTATIIDFGSLGSPLSMFCKHSELCLASLADRKLTSVPLASSLFCIPNDGARIVQRTTAGFGSGKPHFRGGGVKCWSYWRFSAMGCMLR